MYRIIEMSFTLVTTQFISHDEVTFTALYVWWKEGITFRAYSHHKLICHQGRVTFKSVCAFACLYCDVHEILPNI